MATYISPTARFDCYRFAALRSEHFRNHRHVLSELQARFKTALKMCPFLFEERLVLSLHNADRDDYEYLEFELPSHDFGYPCPFPEVTLRGDDTIVKYGSISVASFFNNYMDEVYSDTDELLLQGSDQYAWMDVICIVNHWVCHRKQLLGLRAIDWGEWIRSMVEVDMAEARVCGDDMGWRVEE
jgi:hypothetical protein